MRLDRKCFRPALATWPRVFGFALFFAGSLGLLHPSHGEDPPAAGARGEKPQIGVATGQMEARFADGSLLKITLLDSHLRLKTEYGELRIPTGDIRRLDFATRISDERARQIDAAMGELGDDDYELRERASKTLAGLGATAYPALLKAAESNDLEVVNRAEELLAAIRKALPAEQYEVREDDFVHTAKSKIAGRIDAASLVVATEPFGKQELKVALLRSLRSTAAGAAETKTALPDPGTLSTFQGQEGQVLYFQITGGMPGGGRGGLGGGSVWGTDVYTLDSTLAMAAVHAGAVRSGETGVVAVTILAPQASFEGSFRNGVTSSSWGQFPGAFKFADETP